MCIIKVELLILGVLVHRMHEFSSIYSNEKAWIVQCLVETKASWISFSWLIASVVNCVQSVKHIFFQAGCESVSHCSLIWCTGFSGGTVVLLISDLPWVLRMKVNGNLRVDINRKYDHKNLWKCCSYLEIYACHGNRQLYNHYSKDHADAGFLLILYL